MTSAPATSVTAARALALRALAVAAPVAFATWCALTLVRLVGVPRAGTRSPLLDLAAAAAIGGTSAVMVSVAHRLARGRPSIGVPLLLASGPLSLAVAWIQLVYAIGVGVGGFEHGLFQLETLVTAVSRDPGFSLGGVLGLGLGSGLPLAHDAAYRLRGRRVPTSPAIMLPLLAALVLGVFHVMTNDLAKQFDAHHSTVYRFVFGVLAGGGAALLLVGAPLGLLLAWASRAEDRRLSAPPASHR